MWPSRRNNPAATPRRGLPAALLTRARPGRRPLSAPYPRLLYLLLSLPAALLLATPGARAATGLPEVADVAKVADEPLVFNAPQSAQAGDIIGLQGAHFGAAPEVLLDSTDGSPARVLAAVNHWDDSWVAVRLPADATGVLRVRVRNTQGGAIRLSAPVTLNGAHPYHLDALQIVAQGALRIFGRNLLLPGSTPSVRINGLPAAIDLEHSDAQQLLVTAPPGLPAGTRAVLEVDNGNGSGPAVLERAITVGEPGPDVLGLGVGWAGAFAALGARTVLADSDPRLHQPVRCDGIQDDTAALQAGLDLLAAHGGGVLQLPAGNCRLAGTVQLRSHVILQGAGRERTTLRYEHNYPLFGRGLDLVAVRALTLDNAAGPIEAPLLQDSERVALQDLRFSLGGGVHMFLTGNRNMVVRGSDIVQPENPRGYGPVILNDCAGLSFVDNTVQHAMGAVALARVHDAYLAHNHFVRDARTSQNDKGVVHMLALDFAYRIAIVDNRFDVLGGPVRNTVRNDGETLLSEGGGAERTERTGHVGSASATTLQDAAYQPRPGLAGETGLPENLAVAIVGGTGSGQTRRLLAALPGLLRVDRPWDQLPDRSSRYATFVWGLQEAQIARNTLDQNPRGIWLYQTAVRDVDIIDNHISDGGGIYLRSAQNLHDGLFTPMYGVRVAGNQIVNTQGPWAAYVGLAFVRMDESDFGIGSTGVEIRHNLVQAQQPNVHLTQEEAGTQEGYSARMRAEGASQALSLQQTRLLGTIFQDNTCQGCDSAILVRNGAQATVQDGNHF